MADERYDLVDLATAKTYLRESGLDDDGVIGRMTRAATAAMELFCWRRFLSRSYADWLDGTGGDILWLPNYPVTQVDRVCTETIDALRIKNTSADATYATIRPTATGLTLVVSGGANASSNTKVYASYATITLLAATINTIGKGWSATILNDNGSLTSASIRAGRGARGCLNNAKVGQVVDLQLPGYPLENIELDADLQRLHAPSGFPGGVDNIFVAYSGGYDPTNNTYAHAGPLADLRQICLDLVKSYLDRRDQDATLQSESLGDYSYAVATMATALPDAIKARLLPYRRAVV